MSKKSISFILALLIAVTSFAAVPLTASAEEADLTASAAVTEEIVPQGNGPTAETAEAAQETQVTEPAEQSVTEAPTQEPTQAPVIEDYPKITAMENLETGVKISWDNYQDNKVYRVYYRKAAQDTGTWEQKYGSVSWERVGNVTGNSFVHTGVSDAELGIYTIRSVGSNGEFSSDFNGRGWENRYYAAPAIKSLSLTVDGVRLTWNRAKGAQDYRIYRKTPGGYWSRIANTKEEAYTDTTAESGKTYIYTLRMLNEDGTGFISDFLLGKQITYVAAPVIKSFTNLENGVKLTWDKVPGADYYRIYYRSSNGWTRLVSKYLTEYVDTSVKDGETRVYTIRCLNENDDFVSDFYGEGWSNTYFAAPVIQTLSNTTQGVKLTWNRAPGAQDYRVYRKTPGTSWLRVTQTKESSFTDTTVESGKTYIYTLRMITEDSETFMSDFNTGKSITFVAAPVIKNVENLSNGAKITWNKVPGADSYRIYYWNGSSWTRLITKYLTEYVDTSVKDGQIREYTIRCLDENDNFVSDYYRRGYTNTYFKAPVIKELTGTQAGVLIEWNKAQNAENYRIYRKTEGSSWTRLGQTGESSYTDTTAVKGVTYTYTLRVISADGERFLSDFTSGKSITCCEMPVFSSIYNGNDGVVLKWNAVTGADTYRIYYKESSGWKRLTSLKDTRFTDTSVKDGESRVYTIRCFDTQNNFASDFNTEGWTQTYFAPPAITSVTYQHGNYTLKWADKPGVAKYCVYRMILGDEDWTRIAEITENEFVDEGVPDQAICSYTLRLADENGAFISWFITDNLYYRNGSSVSGTITVNGVTYKLVGGKLQKGFVREGGKLHYYSENGQLARETIVGSDSVGYYYADGDGICYESEDMRLAAEFMMRYCTGNTLQERMKSGYLYLAHQFPYQRRYTWPRSGADMPDTAIDMFTNHNGDCYRYAACFTYLAKIAGYRARMGIGETGGAHADHGWTEVYVDGEWLYCDPDAEIPSWNEPDYSRYMMKDHAWKVIKHWQTELFLENGEVIWR